MCYHNSCDHYSQEDIQPVHVLNRVSDITHSHRESEEDDLSGGKKKEGMWLSRQPSAPARGRRKLK